MTEPNYVEWLILTVVCVIAFFVTPNEGKWIILFGAPLAMIMSINSFNKRKKPVD